MYRVFESLDELVTVVEEARGVPMTAGCVVSRGDVLELLDDVRDAIPAELDDAQDVLDRRDELLTAAQERSDEQLRSATAEAEQTRTDARDEASRLVGEAREHAEKIVANAQAEAERTVAAGRQEYEQLTGRAEAEAERMTTAGRAAYDRAVADGHAEQERLVNQTEVVHAARAESARLVEEATDQADRLRADCDAYVDSSLAEFEEQLTKALRTIGRGRHQYGGQSGVPVSAGAGDRY